MAQGIWQGSGGGGVNSEDVTATRDKVVQGFTALTSDSDDEPIEGTIIPRGFGQQDTSEFGISSGKAYARFEPGYYESLDGVHKPWVWIPFELLASVLGVDPQKMLNSLTIAGRQGAIPEHPNGQDTWAIGWDGAISKLWVRLPRRNGYYGNPGNDPWLYITKEQLISTLGLNPGYWLDNYECMGVRGHIGRWVCTTGDAISAWNNEGLAWDDAYAGRGRGILARIPSGSRIENANWVFLPSPNLQPWNIRAGVNVNGVTGTLVDYGAGGVAFNGATFDGRLLSGVARLVEEYQTKIMRFSNMNIQPQIVISGNNTTVSFNMPPGYFNATANFYNNFPYIATSLTLYNGSARQHSVAFNPSVNLTPFSRITCDLTVRSSQYENRVTPHFRYAAAVSVIPKDVVLSWKNNNSYQGVIAASTGVGFYNYSYNMADRGMHVSLDVSGLQGHHMLVVTVYCASAATNTSSYCVSGFTVNNITFHN